MAGTGNYTVYGTVGADKALTCGRNRRKGYAVDLLWQDSVDGIGTVYFPQYKSLSEELW